MKVEMWEADGGGYFLSFETSTKRKRTTWFSNPPSSIDHVDKSYLQNRLPNVSRESQVEFIKKRFKEEMEKLRLNRRENGC